jgi:hypothetical protein
MVVLYRAELYPIIDAPMSPVYNFAINYFGSIIGEVLELADRRDLGSRAERREGSNPSFPTI